MYGRSAAACGLLLVILPMAVGQKVSRAYAGTDGRAHVVYANGVDNAMAPEPQQVGCSNVSTAMNGRSVGWSVLVENCCTSYPIPISIVVYTGKKKAVISPGQMVWEWQFIGNGDRIAVLSGPVHGWASEARLYDAQTAKPLASWRGKGTAPDWAGGGWGDKFEPQPARR